MFVTLCNLFACAFYGMGKFDGDAKDHTWAMGSNLDFTDEIAHHYPAAIYW